LTALHSIPVQALQWLREDGQALQWLKEDGLALQWIKEDGQALHWLKEDEGRQLENCGGIQDLTPQFY
jgi:hypothetical protein